MSLGRLVYYAAVVCGWSAFLGWLIAEVIILRGDGGRGGSVGLALVGGIVGAAIGAGLNVVSGLGNPQWHLLIKRIPIGLLAGGLGGLVGITVGNLAYTYLNLPRALGFIVLGLGVGIVEGVHEKSGQKMRNGIIGGLIGGLIGGSLYIPLNSLIESNTGMPSRMMAFLVLGTTIGAMIGLVQVVLKNAWLTVVDGYLPGRQLILAQDATILGRAEHLPLPFFGTMNREVDDQHLRIQRTSQGHYQLEDLGSSLGTYLNHQPIDGLRPLADGDLIKLGPNIIRFNERTSDSSSVTEPVTTTSPVPRGPAPPPRRRTKKEPSDPVQAKVRDVAAPIKKPAPPSRQTRRDDRPSGPAPPPPPRRKT
jgi:hypothetical protein